MQSSNYGMPPVSRGIATNEIKIKTALETPHKPMAAAAPPPAFADIAKFTNDLLSKDFYHTSAADLEVKTKAPNGVAFTVKGKGAHEGPVGGNIEAKYADKSSGITCTQGWTTANSVDTKLELEDTLAKGLKAEVTTNFAPASQRLSAKLNIFFKQPNFHLRAFVDPMRGPTVNFDAVLGHEGFLVGAEAGYDVGKAAISKYSAAIGYSVAQYTTAITASNNLSVFSASYYQKVNNDVEVGGRATWDSKAGSAVGLELASKYKLDPMSFLKARINDRGIAALAYNIKVRNGITFGFGASVDTQKMDQPVHKVGFKFAFES